MSYTTAQARAGILEEIAAAVAELETAMGQLGEAYELLDEQTADHLEADLFRPVQQALGRAKATAAGFAGRHGLGPAAVVAPGTPGVHSQGAASFVTAAGEAVEEAATLIAELQDSMAPVEVGDAELRAGLASIREIAETVPHQVQEFLRRLGR
ncbi:hypothetical protein GKE82_07205 [Conexibacter sp. W3-3-2]|uniref:hypothetical protein n=1 Tax=Conexibacter sp. W3-3-2 TaxID=2675227 RepID=UPI0012B952E2|nr:hypothetical protein [Conexibacter sp. W3-3-2]MTD44096.1 hypothetical protein [Conexibacter sp. W3-3-2]